MSQLPLYLKAQENQNKVPLERFWKQNAREFFKRFLAEDILKSTPPYTPEQVALMGQATAVTRKRLKAWMRYRERPNVAASMARRSQPSLLRLLAPKLYGPQIKEAVIERGYNELTEEADRAAAAADAGGAPGMTSSMGVMLTEEEEEGADLRDILLAANKRSQLRSVHMGLWQGTARALWKNESPEVVAEVEKATEEANAQRSIGNPENDEEMMPVAYQHGIDQIGAVFAKVHEIVKARTGWYGFTILGGPMPRRDGQISTKTICFGETENGNNFSASSTDFDASVKVPFQSWLKMAFPHEVRDTRALPTNDDKALEQPEGLITLDPTPEDDDNDEDLSPASTRPKSMPKTANPSTSVMVPVTIPAASATSGVATPVPVVRPTTVVIPTPTDAAVADTPPFLAAPLLLNVPPTPPSPTAVPEFTPPAGFDEIMEEYSEDFANPFDYDRAAAEVWRRSGGLTNLMEGDASASFAGGVGRLLNSRGHTLDASRRVLRPISSADQAG
ncbi:hypothetical protein MVEN_00110000 [Mycena venus]|uniref:Uncharacterized protein n=1 Tax=Mycena venus TaxID=2733690 RepID=A0A8H6Z4M2_9AGAR|nr:hypothetical protein MVEN_00110000 [Mycena venus]